MKEIVATNKAPQAIGPYSQAVVVGNMIFTSGMIPIVPETGEVLDGDITAQATQAIGNLIALLKEVGASAESVVKTTVFIKNMDDFAEVNAVYATFFKNNFPARSCVEVARLPKDVLIEIEAVAVKA
ncbi:MAG: RidA family protein [Lachnospiraceae bacterium]|nr:RidA family protein [Lachnospiraceae bacterium]